MILMTPSLRNPFIALLVTLEFFFVPLFLGWILLLILLGRRDGRSISMAPHSLFDSRG
jgi:hypothetical protein